MLQRLVNLFTPEATAEDLITATRHRVGPFQAKGLYEGPRIDRLCEAAGVVFPVEVTAHFKQEHLPPGFGGEIIFRREWSKGEVEREEILVTNGYDLDTLNRIREVGEKFGAVLLPNRL
jgi:hypothetical protein